MNADGISYLDIGDAYFRGDWQAAINSVWSPLYSWLLGLGLALVKPSMRWEFPLVHWINFLIYLGALGCFTFFWQQLGKYRQTRIAGGDVALPEWAWQSLGYTLFIWTSLSLIELWSVTPDMLMAALVYLAAGLVVLIRRETAAWPVFAALGVTLGLGYLAKTIMLPLAAVFLPITLLTACNLRPVIGRILVALAIFLLITAPFIVAISLNEGRPSFGEAGQLTYIRYVNGLPYPHWQGGPPENGTPLHPSRQIFAAPPIYEFATPIGGTYPISYDPAYWYEGAIPRFDLAQLANRLLASGLYYFDLFFHQQGVLLGTVALLYLVGKRPHLSLYNIIRHWGLAAVTLSALFLYAPVYVEGRYVGVFLVLLWGELLAHVRLPDSPLAQRLATAASLMMLLALLGNILTFNLEGLGILTANASAVPAVDQDALPLAWPGETAAALHRLGVQPGDKVAVIGYAFDSFWARLARVHIVAEMLDRDAGAFWRGDPAFRAEMIATFAGTGARAIVAEHVPGYAFLSGWHQVGDTNYYIYLIE